MTIAGISQSNSVLKNQASNVSFSGKLGKIKSDYPSQMGKPTTVYIDVEGYPTDSYYGKMTEAIMHSRFFHKHSYLDSVREYYVDSPTYSRYSDPPEKFNTVYFLDPDEGISDKDREKYDFVVHDYLPVVPFLQSLKSIYKGETEERYNNFSDLKERADYFQRLEASKEQKLKELKVQYILKGMDERPAITSKMQEVRAKMQNARIEQANAIQAYSIYSKIAKLMSEKNHMRIWGKTDGLEQNEAQFNEYYKELEELYKSCYTEKPEE